MDKSFIINIAKIPYKQKMSIFDFMVTWSPSKVAYWCHRVLNIHKCLCMQVCAALGANARTGEEESLLCCQHREIHGTCVQSVPWQHPHILSCAGRGSWDYY